MTSTSRRTSIETVKCRPNLKTQNQAPHKPEVNRMAVSISLLSPEAQNAMRMTKEDTKLNKTSATQPVITHTRVEHNNDACNNNELEQQGIACCSRGKCSRTNSRAPSLRSEGSHIRRPPVSRRMAASTSVPSGKVPTPRSGSTLSLTDRSHSLSDNTDSCCNCGNNSAIKGMNSTLSSCSIKDSEVPPNPLTDIAKAQTSKRMQNSTNENVNEDSEKVNIADRHEALEQNERPDSFALTLDQVLEKKFIGRLRGDITSNTNRSEPGIVRALDGGRLTNAQEVVVNVCHDDDRELIFNDDDEESMINAKAVSEIRISLWMKYNEGFQPEDFIDDGYDRLTEDGNNNLDRSIDAAAYRAQTTSERSVDKSCSKKVYTNGNKSKVQATKKDVNNNSDSLIKSVSRRSSKLNENASISAASTKRSDHGKTSLGATLKKDHK